MQNLIVIGAGGFGRETLDVVDAINATAPTYRLLGVLDDGPAAADLDRLAARRVPYLGSVDTWFDRPRQVECAVAVGRPAARRGLVERILSAGVRAATLIHPAATVGSQARVAEGVIICAGVQVSTNVVLDQYVQLNPNATVGHDAVLEEFVSVNPGAIVSGACVVGSQTLIGAGAVVLQGLSIGSASTVGAAACVVRDVPAHSTVKGVPAR